MNASIQNISDRFEDLFPPCRECVYWEAPEKCGSPTEAFTIKKNWFMKTQIIFGNCGKILYINGIPGAYIQYCPSNLLENAAEYAQVSPVSEDAILISCIYVLEGYRKQNFGTQLLQAVIHELKERRYKAVETYSRDDSPNNCSGPTAFYLKNGFKILRSKAWENALFSLVRLDLAK